MCEKCFKALGVSSKLRIYQYLLHKGTATVSEVVEEIQLTQPTISYHLKEMKNAGLLTSKKDGKKVYYQIDHDCKRHNCKCILSQVTFPLHEHHAVK